MRPKSQLPPRSRGLLPMSLLQERTPSPTLPRTETAKRFFCVALPLGFTESGPHAKCECPAAPACAPLLQSPDRLTCRPTSPLVPCLCPSESWTLVDLGLFLLRHRRRGKFFSFASTDFSFCGGGATCAVGFIFFRRLRQSHSSNKSTNEQNKYRYVGQIDAILVRSGLARCLRHAGWRIQNRCSSVTDCPCCS